MRINDYGPQVTISRTGMEYLCHRLVRDLGYKALWNSTLQKYMFRYGCFDQPITYPEFEPSKYFGNLGVEIEHIGDDIWRCNGYAHFNLRGVNPLHFGIHRQWASGEFAPFMKSHPAIYKRVAIIKEQCDFINIHIHDNINTEWGPY